MWQKVGVSKRFCDGERNFFDALKGQCQVFCVKIFFKLMYYEITIYLKFYKPHSLLKIMKM